MKKLFLKSFNHLIELNKSVIKVDFEDPIKFRECIKNFDDETIFSENNKEFDIKKKCLKIFDPFNIDLQDKKITTELYKCMKRDLSDDLKNRILEIESSMIALLDDISISMDCSIDYEENVDITKIFSLFQVCLKEIEYRNFLDFIINYIKLNKEFYDYNVVISVRLVSMLTEDEFKLFEDELNILEVKLIDIDLHNNVKNDILIDKDWCVI